jgi:pyruvate/2-oxoglutarate dehydrogenase complex dihydrolipoamide dehydrogenase (E3) component
MIENIYDIIVIGAGSGGLSVGLTMNKLGFKVLMIAKSDKEIGGECLNDGCVPSKALIHVSRIAHQAKIAADFGLEVNGKIDLKKVIGYVEGRQEIIRVHENAAWLKDQGINVALGEARFINKNEIEVNDKKYIGKKIVIATGSKPRKLNIAGVENVKYYDNENIFHTNELPENLLVIGGGPISMEISQALRRLGSNVTVVQHAGKILEHDDNAVTDLLLNQLQNEGINFLFNADIDSFNSANEAIIKLKDGRSQNIYFDAVFVGIGRELLLNSLELNNAGIEVKSNKIVIDKYLRTTNKNVFVCGDIAGDLMFSHAAEFHARILINNFLSPLKKKLNNDHMSWVTFTDPEIATFGLNEKQLKDRSIKYEKLEQDFSGDDRAITDNYQYAKIILYISKGSIFKKEKILGGTMIAPNAGELIQELILANTSGLSINSIFNKIYPYPVASRVNQHLIVKHKQKSLTPGLIKILQVAHKIFS